MFPGLNTREARFAEVVLIAVVGEGITERDEWKSVEEEFQTKSPRDVVRLIARKTEGLLPES